MSPAQPLLAALRRILRPLVRVLLRHGVPYPVFSDVARWVYADEAAREFRIPGRKQTNSRISVLTGLSRKEVLRLRRLRMPTDESAVERFHRASRIVSAWVRESGFQDSEGEPSPLPFEGPRPSFSQLVADRGGDVPPRSVLDELLRVGAVEWAEDGRVRLVTRAYVPASGDAGRLAILGTDVAALISTIDHNLGSEPKDRFFQRKVAYRGVPAGAVPRIRSLGARQAQRLLEMLDRELDDALGASPPEGQDETHRPETKRVMLGIYWFEEDEGDEEPEPRDSTES